MGPENQALFESAAPGNKGQRREDGLLPFLRHSPRGPKPSDAEAQSAHRILADIAQQIQIEGSERVFGDLP